MSTPAYPRRSLVLLAAALLVAAAVPAAAQYGSAPGYSCEEPKKNTQCNEFGTIKMDSQAKIRGDPIQLAAQVTLNTNYEDRDARWILFSIRNVTDDGGNPVQIQLDRLASPHGDVITTEVRRAGPNEVNVWVHAMDVPVGQPIDVMMTIGSSDRGAYQLEVLVMPFDRGYAPLPDVTGQDISLFASTLLSVSEATEENLDTAGEGGSYRNKVPGPGLPIAAGAVLGAAFVALRRRKA